MDRAMFFAAVRRRTSGVFGTSRTQGQVDGINGILDAFTAHGDGGDKTLAYVLATAYHETGSRMVPVREGFTKDDATERRIVAKREYGTNMGSCTTGGPGAVDLAFELQHLVLGRGL